MLANLLALFCPLFDRFFSASASRLARFLAAPLSFTLFTDGSSPSVCPRSPSVVVAGLVARSATSSSSSSADVVLAMTYSALMLATPCTRPVGSLMAVVRIVLVRETRSPLLFLHVKNRYDKKPPNPPTFSCAPLLYLSSVAPCSTAKMRTRYSPFIAGTFYRGGTRCVPCSAAIRTL